MKNYPYRDDGLAIWDAIYNWVKDYTDLYYKTDADVQNDYELANWVAEISDPNAGRVNDFAPAEGITTKTMLWKT